MPILNSYQINELLLPILRQMEADGVYVDFGFLAKFNEKVGLQIGEIEDKIYKIVGHEFNLNSPSQLAKVLYEELGIKLQGRGIRRKKTHLSTDAESLEKLKHMHKVVPMILEYRELAKLKNTYLDPLPRLIGADGRIHTHYAVDTATGRLSSKNPNLQNIPSSAKATEGRPAYGAEVRKAFKAENGYKLLAADYSQIELRIAAHFSGDPTMMEVFKNNGDIHRATAEELGVDRRTAKIVNFSILYGVSSYGLAASVGIAQEEAQLLIDKYFVAFPKLKQYIEELIKSAREKGYVKTLFGYKREIPELHSPIASLRNFGERAAVNTPFQGTAADIIKLAMITLNSKLQISNNKQIPNFKSQIQNKLTDQPINQSTARLILQIHDELIFEVKNDQINEVAKIVKEVMENVVTLKVPIIVDIKVGDNWEEMEEIR